MRKKNRQGAGNGETQNISKQGQTVDKTPLEAQINKLSIIWTDTKN